MNMKQLKAGWQIHIWNHLLYVILLMFYYLMMVAQNECVMLLLVLVCSHGCVVKVLKSCWCLLKWVTVLCSLVVLKVYWILCMCLCVSLYCCVPCFWWDPLWLMISLHDTSYGLSGNEMLTRCTKTRICCIHTCKPPQVSSEEENNLYKETCAWWCVLVWAPPWTVYVERISWFVQ